MLEVAGKSMARTMDNPKGSSLQFKDANSLTEFEIFCKVFLRFTGRLFRGGSGAGLHLIYLALQAEFFHSNAGTDLKG